MSKGFRVIWTEGAARDLEEIASFIAVDSPTNARALMKRLKDRAWTLRTMPHRGRYVPELLELGLRAWRELVIHPYRLIYRIEAKKVLVNALLDGRRDLRDVLLDRLLR